MAVLRHYDVRLHAEPSRVVIRPLQIAPGPNATPSQMSRVRRIVDAVRAFTDAECEEALSEVNADFSARHWQTRDVHLSRFAHVARELGMDMAHLSEMRCELIGAYFCHEYSYSAAAIMNPSIVPHMDQSGLREGDLRFILSLRTVGEGHISSISFREGILRRSGDLMLWPQPDRTIAAAADEPHPDVVTARLPASIPISGAVIFPFTAAQSNGLEDLRLVHFCEEGRPPAYYGTYTAYSGSSIRSELLATHDFRTFTLSPLSGAAAANKGMALFPRRIGGDYAMIGRHDGESMYLLRSADLMHWEPGELILKPSLPWELVQTGNCGSPIELDEGWLVLTHGVGAMRRYAISAVLLDKHNPAKVLARLMEPLLSPSNENRDGYVPNVLYTCGALKHGDKLFIPYGIADSSVSFALGDIKDILSEMR